MSKKNYITLVVGIIGVLIFGTGLCMCLIPEWDAFNPGVVTAAIGVIVLIILAAVRRKIDGKPAVKFNGRTIGITVYSIVSALVMGVGMCMIMVWEMMIPGMIVGIIGIIMLLSLIPIIKGLK